jgi:hypothetical protein
VGESDSVGTFAMCGARAVISRQFIQNGPYLVPLVIVVRVEWLSVHTPYDNAHGEDGAQGFDKPS